MVKPDRDIISVRLQNATLDEKSADGSIVAHGWLDLPALLELRVGDYQREVLDIHGRGRKSKLYAAIEQNERIPDIMLGMRGQHFTTRGGSFHLEDDVYIIDGLQRVSHFRKFAVENPERAASIRLGAEVRFNTDRESEKLLFTAMNLNRTAMSPNVILRNAREESNGLLTLYGLTHNDPSFALYNRVSWNQKMSRNELMTALVYCKAAIMLNRGSAHSGGVAGVPGVLQRTAEEIGIQTMRDNTYRFFEVMDEIWGIKGVKYVDMTTHLRGNFLESLARLFVSHENFWDGKRLVVDARSRQKLKTFAINDPNIQKLAASGGSARDLLYRLIVDHMDKGQKIHRLEPRKMPTKSELIIKHNIARGKAQRAALKKTG